MLVKVNFQSAKLPIYRNGNAKVDVDRIGDNKPRPKTQLISMVDCGNPFGTAKNIIHFEQVSNMLAVLIGERPISSFHTPIINGKPIRTRIPELDEIAKDGYVKLNNIYKIETKDKKENDIEIYITEKNTFRKSGPSNSKTGGTITWRKFRNRFYDFPEKLEKYIKCFDKYTSKPFDENHYGSVNEAIREIKNCGKIEELKKDMGHGCEGFFTKSTDVLRPNSKDSRFAFLSQDTYSSNIITISGEFIFDINDNNILEKLVTGKKIATYLDGGLATLEKWENNSYFKRNYNFEEEGFKQIKEIDIR